VGKLWDAASAFSECEVAAVDNDPVRSPGCGVSMMLARASLVAVTVTEMTLSSGCDPLLAEMDCWLMSRKLCPAVIMIQVTEAPSLQVKIRQLTDVYECNLQLDFR
jgi:hypothetical protein